MRWSATTWSAQLSCRSPPRLRRWRRCLPLEASTGLVPASAAKEASLRIRPGSPLETSSCAAQTGPTPHSSSRLGASSATSSASAHSASATSIESRSTRRPSRRTTPFATSAPGPQSSSSAGESVAGERSQTRADRIGSGDKNRAELIQGRVPGLHRATALKQQQSQLLAATGAPGKAQPFTAQQSAGSKRRVDQIALPSPPLPSTWTLTLKDLDARTDQEASQPGPIAPRALDREHGRPELARPREQAPITLRRRRDLAAVELSAERVQRDGDVHLLVRVDTDRHRPLHDLTSGSSRWSTGLG